MDETYDDIALEKSSIDDDDHDDDDDDEEEDEDEDDRDPFSTDEDDDYEFPESEESDDDHDFDDDYDDNVREYTIASSTRKRKLEKEKEKKIKQEEKDINNKSLSSLIRDNTDLEEGDIITQFMNEQKTLPDFYTKLTADDVLDEIEDNNVEAANDNDAIGGGRTSFAGIGKLLKRFEANTLAEGNTSMAMDWKMDVTSDATNKDKLNDIDQEKESSALDNADEDYEENDDLLKQPKTVKEKTFRRKTILNATLQGLMGEANLSFARGKIDVAEKICLEIIRQNPLAAEPFFTLASIYENRDTDKFLNFLTIAAHLKPSDRDQWIRIAEIHLARNNLTQARVYLTKAIKYLPRDYDLRLRKARLLERLGEEHVANFTYLKMLPHMPFDEHELCIATAKKLAHYYHTNKKHKFALEAMLSAYAVCGALFNLFDLNLLVDLLIYNKQYRKALDILSKSTSFFMDFDADRPDLIVLCLIPENIIPELRSKICVSLVRLKQFNLSDYMIDSMLRHIPIVVDRLDLFIDVAEAFMDETKYIEALQIIEPLISRLGDDSPALLWLKKGDCLNKLGHCNEAIESYHNVLELAPNCTDARFTLATLLTAQERTTEAIEALNQYVEKGEPLQGQLLYQRCILLKQVGRIDEYLKESFRLLSRYSISLRNREELFALANGGNFYNPDGLKVILQMRNMTESLDTTLQDFNRITNDNSGVTLEQEFELFNNIVKTAFDKGLYSFVEKVCFAMITTKRFKTFHKQLEPIVILACYFNDDCTIGFSYLRELIAKHPHTHEYWNLLSLFTQKGQHLRYHRFVRRLIQRISNLRQMRIFVAHYHLYCCSFKYALNIYVPLFKESQQPIFALCIAVVFNQLSLQKKVLRKSAALAQAITFAQKYAELRDLKDKSLTKSKTSPVQQEIYYNIGRIYHQANLMHLAIDYYEKALSVEDPYVMANEKYLSLKQEIAFNLHLIYKANGNFIKARQYLYEYIVV